MLKQVMNNNKPIFYILFCILYVTQLSLCKVAHRRDDTAGIKEESENLNSADGSQEDQTNTLTANNVTDKEEQILNKASDLENVKDRSCWLPFYLPSHLNIMKKLEHKYKGVIAAYAQDVDTEKFDQKMLEMMQQTRAIAERTLQKFDGSASVIPAGLNLGSYCMMRMPGSVLFFYRMKLRNDTRFTVNYLHNDMEKLTLTLRLSLNDLHLIGQYERALTSAEEPSKLFYRPNKGEVEFLLKDVKYKVEGRYRLLKDRLHIEHILSEMPAMQILMRYTTDTSGKSTPLDPNSLSMFFKIKYQKQRELFNWDYLNRMQSSLDQWLKDYFNDVLMIYGLQDIKTNAEIQKYHNERTIELNAFADHVTRLINSAVRDYGPTFIMPDFTLTAANGMEIRLYDGTAYGLDTMYRRSVATGRDDGGIDHVDADVGFSGLKAEYRYDTFVKTGVPPVSGVFVLNSDDISAHMALQFVNYTPSVPDLHISYLKHGKPLSLTVEGPANRIIANFNHLLEHHVISIMSCTLIHHIRSLRELLTTCDPKLPIHNYTSSFETIEEDSTIEDDESTEEMHDNDETTLNPNDSDVDGPTGNPDNYDDETSPPPPDTEEPEDYKQTESPENSDDDGPTASPERNDSDAVTEPSQDSNDDITAEPPYPESNEPHTEAPEDDKQPESPENSDDVGPTASPESKGADAVTEPSEDSNDDITAEPPYPKSNDNILGKPEYAFVRKESVELELPPKDGAVKGESFKIDHNETFTMTKLNNANSNDEKLNKSKKDADENLNNKNDEEGKLDSNNEEEGKLSNDEKLNNANDDVENVAADDGVGKV